MILYKYVAPERVDVIENRLIRFSQPGALNDPYEASVIFERMIPSDKLAPFVSHLEETGQLESAREEGFERGIDDAISELERVGFPVHLLDRNALRALAISQFEQLGGNEWLSALTAKAFRDITELDHPSLRQVVTDRYREKINETTGILCLSESWNIFLMWSHYADSHSVIVLGFDSTDRYFRQPYVSMLPTEVRPVTYGDEIPRFKGFDPLGDPEQLLSLSEPFFLKGSEWAYEKEWRLLRPLGAARKTIPDTPYSVHLMRFPEYVLREVVIGAKATEAT